MVTVSVHKTVFITNDDGDLLEIFVSDDGYIRIKCPDGKVFETSDGKDVIKDLSING